MKQKSKLIIILCLLVVLLINLFGDNIYAQDNISKNGNYTVTVYTKNGNVKGAGTYNEKDIVVLSATPNKDYYFDGWYDNNNLLSKSIELEVAILNSDIKYEARFKRLYDYKVDVLYDNTKGSVLGNRTYNKHENVILYANPAEKCIFIGWFIDNELLSTDLMLNFNIDKDVLIEARFKKIYIVNVTSVSPLAVFGSGVYMEGEEIYYGFVHEDAVIKTYNINDGTVSPYKEGYTYIPDNYNSIEVNEDLNIEITSDFREMFFEVVVPKCNVNITTNDSSKGVVRGGGTVAVGDYVKAVAVPNVGYSFGGWFDNHDIYYGNDFNLELIAKEDVTIEAFFYKRGRPIQLLTGYFDHRYVETYNPKIPRFLEGENIEDRCADESEDSPYHTKSVVYGDPYVGAKISIQLFYIHSESIGKIFAAYALFPATNKKGTIILADTNTPLNEDFTFSFIVPEETAIVYAGVHGLGMGWFWD